MSFTNANPTDSKESLLTDITAAANQGHMPGLPLRPLAALIVKVADEAAETVADLKEHITKLNKQNAKLQCWVIALAVAALIGTVVQTTAAIYALLATNSSAVKPAATAGSFKAAPPQPLLPATKSKENLARPPAGSDASQSAKVRSSPSSAASPNLER